MKIKKEELKTYLKVIGTFQLMSFIAIFSTFIFDFKSNQLHFHNFVMNAILCESFMLIIPVLTCLIFFFLKQHSDKKYEEFRKNIPEYIYKSDFYSISPFSDKSEKIKISDITEKCNIHGYGTYDPNNT